MADTPPDICGVCGSEEVQNTRHIACSPCVRCHTPVSKLCIFRLYYTRETPRVPVNPGVPMNCACITPTPSLSDSEELSVILMAQLGTYLTNDGAKMEFELAAQELLELYGDYLNIEFIVIKIWNSITTRIHLSKIEEFGGPIYVRGSEINPQEEYGNDLLRVPQEYLTPLAAIIITHFFIPCMVKPANRTK